ncbi:hypothetical protein [Tomitella fengzijianii]|uniref:Uncharacterized protein n=1 Tax=Tomitella fengzijianii TaxID=2597660 RepID=A0A516X3I9_9ACTN|nr:hypothetical protein [Tomitella fengzijianii]QDQ97635.1 hypothetical protein FO059_10260 [Tomitella fengzijianii]
MTELRGRVLAAVGEMAAGADEWFVIGAGEAGDGLGEDGVTRYPATPSEGSFAGFGVDVRVTLDGRDPDHGDPPAAGGGEGHPCGACPDGARPSSMALPLLIAGWLRGQMPDDRCPTRPVTGIRVGRAAAREACVESGRALRREIDARPGRTAVLVIGDGPSTLTAKAPGAFDSRARPLAEAVASAIAAGDAAALIRLEPQQCAQVGLDVRGALQVMAALVGDGQVEVRHQSVQWPLGVGYHTGLWSA